MLSGLEENMVACTCISTNAYTAGNVTSNVYPAGYGRAQDYPHVSTMKTAVFYDSWLPVPQCCTLKEQVSCSCCLCHIFKHFNLSFYTLQSGVWSQL